MTVTAAPDSVQSRSVLDLIGNTPLLSFKRIARDVAPVRVFAKAEWYNPGGSVKDRAALAMILDGERRGLQRRIPDHVGLLKESAPPPDRYRDRL